MWRVRRFAGVAQRGTPVRDAATAIVIAGVAWLAAPYAVSAALVAILS